MSGGQVFAPSQGTTSAPLHPAITTTFHLDPRGRYFASASIHDALSGQETGPSTVVGSTTTMGYQLDPSTRPWEWVFTLEGIYITRPGLYLVTITAMRIRDQGAQYEAQVTSGIITVVA